MYGGTGRFAALRGSATEVYELEKLGRAGGIEEMTAELRLSIDEPADAPDVAQAP